MKQVYYALIVLFIASHPSLYPTQQKHDIACELRAHNDLPTKMRLLVGVIGQDEELCTIARLLADDFSCVLQRKTGFDVTVRTFSKKLSKNQIRELFVQEGFPLVLFLSDKSASSFEWRLYDALQTVMLKGNRVTCRDQKDTCMIAHSCADAVWKELTGNEGIFSTIIAYCKQIDKDDQAIRFIYTRHLSEQEAHCLVNTPSNKLGLRWHPSSCDPVLFFSEHTPVNVRLVSTPLWKEATASLKLVSNFDGLNMQPSFTSDGKHAVLCTSSLGSSQLYYGIFNEEQKQWKFHRITYNNGNNIAPILRENGDIIYCSDFEFRRPQIYYYHADTRAVERITSGSYSASPAWCESKNMLAYVKNKEGVMQLFTYDMIKKEHKQITMDKGNKEEPTWSPEGSYLAYSVEKEKSTRIEVFNLMTNEQFYISPVGEYCCYPAWSPRLTV